MHSIGSTGFDEPTSLLMADEVDVTVYPFPPDPFHPHIRRPREITALVD